MISEGMETTRDMGRNDDAGNGDRNVDNDSKHAHGRRLVQKAAEVLKEGFWGGGSSQIKGPGAVSLV